MRLDLGCGLAKAPGHVGIDIMPRSDIVWDLNNGLPQHALNELLRKDPKVEGIRCHQTIEHLTSIIPLLNDCYYYMADEAEMEISTPYAGTTQWYQDPTHIKAYVPESFQYFAKNSPFEKEQNEYGITARFEIVKAERGTGVDDWQLFVVLRK